MSHTVKGVTDVERIAIKINSFPEGRAKRGAREIRQNFGRKSRGVHELNDFILCDNLLVEIIRLSSLSRYCESLVQVSTETNDK